MTRPARWLPLLTLLALLLLFLVATPEAAPSPAALRFDSKAFPLPGGQISAASPTLADLDGDGTPEVIIGTTAYNAATQAHERPMVLLALRGTGELLWQAEVGAPMRSTPAVGDLDGDGFPEIVVGIGGDLANPDHHGGVVAYDRFGQRLWTFQTEDRIPPEGYSDGVYSSPSLCDVDGDGQREVAFGAWDQRIYLLDHSGNSLWNNLPAGYPGKGYYNADTIWSSPACGDLDNDGTQEVVIGADITGGGILPDGTATSDGGFVYVFDRSGEVLARRYVPEAAYSSPALGDLDGDGRLEIVIGTSFAFWLQNQSNQPYVYVFSTERLRDHTLPYSDPLRLPDAAGWPQPTALPGFSSPAIGDLDGDGTLEVVIGAGRPSGQSVGCAGRGDDPACWGAVYAWHHDGQPVSGFPAWPQNGAGENGTILSSPSLADVDLDGQVEILIGMLWDVIVLAPNGQQETLFHTIWSVSGTPAVGDTTGNERLEVWIGGGHYEDQAQGYLWRFEQAEPGSGARPWPMFREDPLHTARFDGSATLHVPDIILYHDPSPEGNSPHTIPLTAQGEEPITWSVTQQPPTIVLETASGTVEPGHRFPITLRVADDSLAPGRHELGTLTIEGLTAQGTLIDPVTVPVIVHVGSLNRLHLPLILR